MYYRQKKERPVTRPQALEETFEHCAETVVYKLQSYLVQADEYHNKCLQGEYQTLFMVVVMETDCGFEKRLSCDP